MSTYILDAFAKTLCYDTFVLFLLPQSSVPTGFDIAQVGYCRKSTNASKFSSDGERNAKNRAKLPAITEVPVDRSGDRAALIAGTAAAYPLLLPRTCRR